MRKYKLAKTHQVQSIYKYLNYENSCVHRQSTENSIQWVLHDSITDPLKIREEFG